MSIYVFNQKNIEYRASQTTDEEVEPVEIGSLIHSILYEFYTEIVNKNISIENCSEEVFEQLVDLLFNIANKKTKKENFSNAFSFFELEKIFGINGNKRLSVLYRFLEEERKTKNGFQPSLFEKKFGRYDDKSHVKINDIYLQGSIDRIDLNQQENLFTVIDYKLRGKKISANDIDRGISLQLPLYLYAAKCLLENEFKKSFKPFSAEIYSLKLSQDEFGRKKLQNSTKRNLDVDSMVESNNLLIDKFLMVVQEAVMKLKNCEFHLSRLEDKEEKVCGYCNFRSICRVNEII
jgi:ATP-dependent helicase/DNAse subunit B